MGHQKRKCVISHLIEVARMNRIAVMPATLAEAAQENVRAAYPMTTAEMNVPANAKARMTPKFLKKFACLSSKPELRMIGGKRTLSRIVFSSRLRRPIGSYRGRVRNVSASVGVEHSKLAGDDGHGFAEMAAVWKEQRVHGGEQESRGEGRTH